MAEPYIAEIRIWACNFAPRGWAFCNGQLMSIAQNTALFSLIGTIYGGDGRTTFALPNFQGTTSMHWGNGPGLTTRVIGEMSGEEQVTLLMSEMPQHSHPMFGATPGAGAGAVEAVNTPSAEAWLGASAPGATYATSPNSTLAVQAIGMDGGSLAHNNMQPLLTMNYCIAMEGIFPARN